MKHLLLINILFFSALVQGQEHILSGKVTDNQDVPISFANIQLKKVSDSTLVKGVITQENGEFTLNNISDGTYYIETSYLGYETHTSKKYFVNKDVKISTIRLKESAEMLESVSVIGKKPTITKKVDRLVFNVENTIASSGSTYDILSKTPGVIVNQGELLVRNSPAVIYINDRRVYLTNDELQQLLLGFSGENVKSIEVITTPPAKYDAEGGAVINIITSKNISIGYKGSLNASATVARLPKYTVGTSHYYKNNWLNAFVAYTYNGRNDNKRDESFIGFYDENNTRDTDWFTDFNKDTETQSHSLNAILDFTLNENNSLSVSANVLHTPKADSDIDGRTEIYAFQGALDSLFTTSSFLENERDNYLLNLEYTSILDEEGSELSLAGNYINYKNDQRQQVSTQYFSPQGNLINQNSFLTLPNQDSEIYTAQADVSTTIDTWGFGSGLKYSGLQSESNQDFFNTNGGDSQFISDLSDRFIYDEQIYAAYINLDRSWDAWSIQAGLRAEYTDVEGDSQSLGLVNTQEYFELFPTFYIMNTLNENHTVSLNYSRRIDRPRFQTLNPFNYYINENNFTTGDPNVQPAFTNNVTFNYTYKGKLSFDLYWERVEGEMQVLPFQDNEARLLRSITTNTVYDQQFSLDLTYYEYLKDWWLFYTYNSLFYKETEFIALQNNNQAVTEDVTGVFSQIYNSFDLNADRTFTGEVSTYFFSNYVSGSYTFDRPQFGLDIGLRKTLYDKRLVLTVNAEDIFNTMNIPLSSRYLTQNNSYLAMPETSKIRFGIRYNFGNFKLSDNERPTQADEQDRLKALEINN